MPGDPFDDPNYRRWWYEHNFKMTLAIASLNRSAREGQKKLEERERRYRRRLFLVMGFLLFGILSAIFVLFYVLM